MENWVLALLAKSKTEVIKRLAKKLKMLRENKSNEQKKVKPAPKLNVDKKVMYNNSSKQLTKEQLEVLALGLNFGIVSRKFPMVEYITAMEVLCQKLEEGVMMSQ